MGETVLIVDDEEELRDLMGISLSTAGYTVEEAVNGVDALAKLDGGMRPIAVLLDGNMPKLNGLDTLAKMKASDKLREIPVILVSAYGSESKITQARQAGAAGYIVKPFPFGDLPGKIKSILSGLK